MINFQPLTLDMKPEFDRLLRRDTPRGCEYSFNNLYLWGRQQAAFEEGYLVVLSQYNRRCVYLFPAGHGDVKPVLDAIIADARERGIPCCISSMNQEECDLLESLYPGKFRFHSDRDFYDYVYDINDLAELRGRKFQKKRNHLHKFQAAHPEYTADPLTDEWMPAVQEMVDGWFAQRLAIDPTEDFHLERRALRRAFAHRKELGMEGLVLVEDGKILAMTMGSPLSETTFDIHFEKALLDVEGAYNAINLSFARYLREKYPNLRWLDREDDMGLEGLRKAKLSYNPAFLLEKYWARLWEDTDEL